MSLPKEIILSKIKSSFLKALNNGAFIFYYTALLGYRLEFYSKKHIQYYFLPFKITFHHSFYDDDNEVTIYFKGVEYTFNVITKKLTIYEKK